MFVVMSLHAVKYISVIFKFNNKAKRVKPNKSSARVYYYFYFLSHSQYIFFTKSLSL